MKDRRNALVYSFLCLHSPAPPREHSHFENSSWGPPVICSSPDALLCPSQACAAPPPSECQHPPRVFLLWNSSWGRYCQLKRRVHISGSTGQSMGHPQKMATWFSVSVGTLAYFINQEVLFQRTNVERGHIIGLRNYVSLMINKSLPQWEGVPWNLCPQMHSQTTRRLTLGGYWMGK